MFTSCVYGFLYFVIRIYMLVGLPVYCNPYLWAYMYNGTRMYLFLPAFHMLVCNTHISMCICNPFFPVICPFVCTLLIVTHMVSYSHVNTHNTPKALLGIGIGINMHTHV